MLPSSTAVELGGLPSGLALNESPFPPHPAVIEAMQAAATSMNRYPDPTSGRLRGRLTERYGVAEEQILVGSGSCELLLAAAVAFCRPGDRIVYAWPSFSMYSALAPMVGGCEVRVPLAEGDLHDLEQMAAAVEGSTRLLVICNPNNPTATHIKTARIVEFLEAVPPSTIVVLDEAYIEFQTNEDPDASIDLLPSFPNLLLLRTFSKCFGLAGLRVGFSLGAPALGEAIDAVRQPFSLSAMAEAAAAEALLHPDDVTRRVQSNTTERNRIQKSLRELGCRTPDSQANFSWIHLDPAREDKVISALAADGVAVRSGSSLGAPGALRVTYSTSEENDAFLASITKALSTAGIRPCNLRKANSPASME